MKTVIRGRFLMISFIAVFFCIYGDALAVVLFHDDFEYAANNNSEMVLNGPWQGFNNSNGNVSTVTTVNNGAAMPKVGSRCGYWYMGALDRGFQTDNHVSVAFAANTWGPDLWWQCWIYIADSGTQKSGWTGSRYDVNEVKWFYFDTRGAGYNIYPIGCIGMDGFNSSKNSWDSWLGGTCTSTYPYLGNNANMFLQMRIWQTNLWTESCQGLQSEIVPQTGRSHYIQRNKWILLRQHLRMDSSHGRWEAWIDMSDGNGFVKVADWNNKNTGLAYQHSVEFKLGTTWPSNPNYVLSNGYVYIDDLYVATSESDLPPNGSDLTAPSAPRNVRILSE